MNSQTMTSAQVTPASISPQRVNPLLPAFTLWWREVVRFYRQPARVVGVVVSPLLFWVVIGAGFGTSLQKGATGTGNFLNYFFPGALMMIVLFTSIFTMMSVIEDRNEGFLLSVMVAPVHRSGIVLGKVLGGTTLSAIQGLLFLVFAPFIGLKFGLEQFLIVVLVTFLVAFALTALGFVIAWRMESAQGFHAIINLFLIPLWMLSGALFPVHGASGWLKWLMDINPLKYGMDALLLTLFPAGAPVTTLSLWPSIAVLAGFAALVFLAGFAWPTAREPFLRHKRYGRLQRFSRSECRTERRQRSFAYDRTRVDRTQADQTAPRLHDCGVCHFQRLPGLLFVLPCTCRLSAFSGAGLDTAAVFHDFDFAYSAGSRSGAAGTAVTQLRIALPF